MQSLSIIILSLSVPYFIVSAEITCGVVSDSKTTLESRISTRPGSWPWIASLHNAKNDEFFCGATLIGSHAVLTVCLMKRRLIEIEL